MAAEGPNYPDIAVEDTAEGTEPWSYESNACADDDSHAVTDYTDESGGGSDANSFYLKCTDFDFAIPTGATIDGIELEVEANATYANFEEEPYIYSGFSSPRLVKDGSLTGYGGLSPSEIETFDQIASAGGPTDKWGDTWTPADINANDFGVAIQVSTYCDPYENQSVYVDFVRLTVYYTVAGADITGVAAQTLPALTQAAAGQVIVSGVAAQTLPALTQVAAGQVIVSGVAAQTLPALTQAAAGQVGIEIITGSAAQTLPAITQAAAGQVIVSGAAAQTLAALIQAAAGQVSLKDVSLANLRIGHPRLSAARVDAGRLADCRVDLPQLATASMEPA